MPRVDDALSSLVSALLPALPEEDETSSNKRHEDALVRTKEILRTSVVHSKALPRHFLIKNSHTKSAEVYDINHVSDLIKKKRWSRVALRPRPS